MKRKGFTLIELLIVIAIIGVLAAALYPTIRDALSRGRDGAREGDINNLVTAIETYNIDFGTYPAGGGCITDATIFEDLDNPGTFIPEAYFKGGKPPLDPAPNRSIPTGLSGTATTCVENGQYYYLNLVGADGVEFIIGTIMESEKNNNFDGDPSGFDTATYTLDGEDYYVKVL